VQQRRRRARRRAGSAAVVVIALAVMVALVLTGGSSQGRYHLPSSGAGAPTDNRTAVSSARRVRRHATSDSRAVDRVLSYTMSYVRFAGRRRREVALTFDDGPGQFTRQIIKILERTHTPATFFVIGRWTRAYPGIVGAEARDGFAIGDHTETHAYLSLLSPAAQAAQIDAGAVDIHNAGAPYPRLFRPPYGAFDHATLALLHTRRLLMVLWSVDTKDYTRPGAERIIYTAVSGAQPGAIILMHDGGGDRSQTVAALPRIIKRLRQRGFRLVTIPQLVADDPPPRNQPAPTPLSGRA
jgi:peptidoglycan/xylan/chitin deacetylase (PgdA/CDA1 family)